MASRKTRPLASSAWFRRPALWPFLLASTCGLATPTCPRSTLLRSPRPKHPTIRRAPASGRWSSPSVLLQCSLASYRNSRSSRSAWSFCSPLVHSGRCRHGPKAHRLTRPLTQQFVVALPTRSSTRCLGHSPSAVSPTPSAASCCGFQRPTRSLRSWCSPPSLLASHSSSPPAHRSSVVPSAAS